MTRGGSYLEGHLGSPMPISYMALFLLVCLFLYGFFIFMSCCVFVFFSILFVFV